LPGGFEQVERADGVRVEVVERDRGGAVVARLSGGVNDGVGLQFGEQLDGAGPVADVEFVMLKRAERRFKPPLVPAGVARLPEEDGPLVVVDAVNSPAKGVEKRADFRADEPRRTSDEKGLHAGYLTPTDATFDGDLSEDD
jgi:hypothetical protein